MTVQFSVGVRNARLDAIESAVGSSAVLKVRTGAPPVDVAAADSGIVVATVNLPADWMTNAAAGAKAKSGTWDDSAADASGIAAHYRIYANDGTTCHIQGLVSMAWAQSTAYVVGQVVHVGDLAYRCVTAGTSAGSGTGPSGTGNGISDGSVTWNYAGIADMKIDNTNFAAGQAFSVTTYAFAEANA